MILRCVIMVALFAFLCGCQPEQTGAQSQSMVVGFIYDPAVNWQSRSYGVAKEFSQRKHSLNAECMNGQLKIKLEPMAIEATPQQTSKAVLELINKRRVNVIVSPLSSRNLQAAMPYIEETAVPLIAIAATSLQQRSDAQVIALSIDNNRLAESLASLTKNELNSAHAIVVYRVNDRYSSDMAENFVNHFDAMGGETISLAYTDIDTQLLAQIEANLKPESVLFLPVFKQDLIPLVSNLRARGVLNQLIGGDSWEVEYLSLFSFLDGAIAAQSWFPSSQPQGKELDFLARYRAQNQREPIPVEALTEDAMGFIRHIICSHKNFKGELFARFLTESTPYNGISGKVEPQSIKGGLRQPSFVMFKQGQAAPWPSTTGENDG